MRLFVTLKKTREVQEIYFSVTNDLTGDQRVHRIISSLVNAGAKVSLVGRKLGNSLPLNPRNYKTYRLNLIFRKGFLFYAFFNVRLFFFLLFRRKIDILVANDLDTLAANYFVSRLRGIPLVYDSHEYFTEVPELIGRKKVREFWLKIEKAILPSIKYAYTVSYPIAEAYQSAYGVDFKVIRNYPLLKKDSGEFLLPFNTGGDKLLVYQGAVNVGRGLEILIDIVGKMDNVKFVIAGDGDIRKSLEKKVEEENLGNRIFFLGKIPLEQLHNLTKQANGGVSLEEDLGLNYRFAMPNKLFDYIQAGIPVLVSDLPEMKKIVEKYNIGIISASREKESIQDNIKTLLFNEEMNKSWKPGLELAANELCWENEEKRLLEIYFSAGLINL
jgi:glycosyltransferase involved in cell wall biosynthesis